MNELDDLHDVVERLLENFICLIQERDNRLNIYIIPFEVYKPL